MNILQLPKAGGSPLNTFGEYLRREMQRREMNVSQFAAFLGVSHQTLGKYLEWPKEGLGYPDLSILVKMARALNVDLGTLANLVEPSASTVSPSIMLLAERIQRLPPDRRELVDALILGLAFKQIEKSQ